MRIILTEMYITCNCRPKSDRQPLKHRSNLPLIVIQIEILSVDICFEHFNERKASLRHLMLKESHKSSHKR